MPTSTTPRDLLRLAAVILTACAALLLALLAAPSAEAGPGRKAAAQRKAELALQRPVLGTVPLQTFGMHSFQGRPALTAGAYRVNCAPKWSDIQPARGVFHWTEADRQVAAATSYTSDVLFSFCKTPKWAAQPGINYPEAPPANMADWRTFVRAVVTRYKGRVDAYELWNEATSYYWYKGTPEQMAQMTIEASRIIRAVDPAAKVVSPSLQCCQQIGWFTSFFPRYAKAMAAAGWPIDVLAFHTYVDNLPKGISTPAAVAVRAAGLKTIRDTVKKYRVPTRIKLWDTETNFLRPTDSRQRRAIVARTYLDSWRYGFARTYWYMWTARPGAEFGIPMRPGETANVAYTSMVRWTVGAQFRGCTTDKKLVTCAFTRGGKPFSIAYTQRYSDRQTVKLKRPVSVCEPTGAPCTRKKKIPVTYMPVKLG